MAAALPLKVDGGVRVVKHAVLDEEVNRAVVAALAAAIAAPPGVLAHYETLGNGRTVPARIEHGAFLFPEIATVAAEAQTVAEAVVGRKLRLFKDKVNFKFPGGGTFLAHQDTPAYAGYGEHHVSVAVPLTDFTERNGTLEFGPEQHQVVPMEELATLRYAPIEAAAGDAIVFDGLAPHRSGINASDQPRIGLYLTFVDAAEPDHRGAYYARKAEGIDGMSLNQLDFTGRLA